MSVQCTANLLRALAALPAPFPSRRLARNEFLVPCRPSRTGALVRAADSSPPAAPASSSGAADDKAVIPDDEFTLAKVSFGVIGLGIGGSLLSYGFGAYFNLLPGSEWSALMLTYGFPLTIIGMALKYAELKPVPCITYSDAFALREKCATPILKQGGGIPRRSAPILQKIQEVTDDGKYCLVLEFEAKSLELSDFEKRQNSPPFSVLELRLKLEKVVTIYMKCVLSRRPQRKSDSVCNPILC
ncbi:thylakoid membrane protein slr0575 isoform X9 [Triticum aestivum]|uniref:thylakoid membrane protein slr0575 isoform X9 n=1 Tax=Triticum aestivum TaxID=4565 RepID=UPI001D02DFD8|nr:thylakoid membrane protein slr0575-like isoform X9 [Triticum aestivum]